jgi:hypothetical protein
MSGGDYFLLAMDRRPSRVQSPAHVCRLLLLLDGELDASRLREALEASPLALWIAGMRPRFRPAPLPPLWKSGDRRVEFVITESERSDSLEDLAGAVGEISRLGGTNAVPGLAFHIMRDGRNRSVLVMSWHHAVMDAHGAELFLERLTAPDDMADALPPRREPRKSWFARGGLGDMRDRIAASRQSIRHAAALSRLPVDSLLNGGGSRASGEQRFAVRPFTQTESRRMEARAGELGIALRPGAFFMAGVGVAIHRLLERRGTSPRGGVVPMPTDLRKLGARGPVVSNQISFYFFRVDAALSGDFPALARSLSALMLEQARRRVPEGFSIMTRHFRRVPLWLYSRLVAGPSRGQIASWYFSHTGAVMPRLNAFLGLPILDALHLPPAVCPPGLSAAFMSRGGRTSAVLSWAGDLISAAESGRLLEDLSAILLGEGER